MENDWILNFLDNNIIDECWNNYIFVFCILLFFKKFRQKDLSHFEFQIHLIWTDMFEIIISSIVRKQHYKNNFLFHLNLNLTKLNQANLNFAWNVYFPLLTNSKGLPIFVKPVSYLNFKWLINIPQFFMMFFHRLVV